MSQQSSPQTGDEFGAELSDVRAPTGGIQPVAPPSPLAPRRTVRQRFMRTALTLATVTLAVAVVLTSLPVARLDVGALLARLGPAPVPTIPPGADAFYLLPNPPGVVVLLDGQPLRHLPLPGDPHPLHLAPGSHTFTWRSHLLPLATLTCTQSVPAQPDDTCPAVTRNDLAMSGLALSGTVLAEHETQRALPANGADLDVAIQQALYAARSSAIVKPGERYFSESIGQTGGPVVATQPLRATLAYQLLDQGGYPEPCALDQGQTIPCRFPGQDCSELCTVPGPVPAIAGATSADEWLAAGEVHADWQYATLDGHIVEQEVPEAFGVQLALLRIRWDGMAWHVTPVFGTTPGLPVADDAACDPARFWLGQSTWAFMLADPPPGENTRFAADASPADGCAVVLMHGQPAMFLERFGLLLTVNDAARNPTDNLPEADASEQALALRLLAQPQP